MYTFDARIRFSEVDSEGYLTLPALLDYFQDCSTFQSEDLGVGISFLTGRNMFWVLSSWQIVTDRYPKLTERVKVGTFPYEFKGFFGYRNFFMQDENGNFIAKANSLWTLINMKTYKPERPPVEVASAYKIEDRLEMDYAGRKIAVPEGGKYMEEIVVKKHHLDTNHHVNNGQYVKIAEEYLPEGYTVKQMRAEYRKQAFLDDVIKPYVFNEDDRYVISLNDADNKPITIVEYTGA